MMRQGYNLTRVAVGTSLLLATGLLLWWAGTTGADVPNAREPPRFNSAMGTLPPDAGASDIQELERRRIEQRKEFDAQAEPAMKLWRQYRLASRMGLGSVDDIVRMNNLGLPPTPEVIEGILATLRSGTIPPSHRIELTRLLGHEYLLGPDAKEKAEIEAYLVNAARGEDRELSRAAASTYLRLPYHPDTVDVLTQAYERGVIGSDDYYGDLVHLMPGAPPQMQAALMKELSSHDNPYSRALLAELLGDPRMQRFLAPGTLKAGAEIISKSEPSFPPKMDELGGMDLIGYGKWLSAQVTLTAKANGESPAQVLSRELDPNGDPRKLMAMLFWETTASQVRELDAATRSKIDAAIAQYVQRYQENPNIVEWGRTARQNLVAERR